MENENRKEETTMRMFHATSIRNFESIQSEGLQAGCDGGVYIAGPEMAHAGQFVALRLRAEKQMEILKDAGCDFGEIAGQDPEDSIGVMPELDEETIERLDGPCHMAIWSIDVESLDQNRLVESFDHDSNFFEERTVSMIYLGSIPRESIRFEAVLEF